MSFIKRMRNNCFIKHIGKNVYGLIKKIYMIFCNKVYGVDNKSVVFISFGGKSYSDNPKAISEKLHERNPNFSITWLFIEPDSKITIVPEYITSLKANSFKALKALATSKYWVDNFNKPLFMYKSKEQVYIQTWHGDRGFKKILYDSTFVDIKNYKLFESKSCDLAVAGSDYGVNKFRSAFKYEGDILRKGCPRNDTLINITKQSIEKLKNKYGVEKGINILLYAPTLRRSAAKEGLLQSVNDIDIRKLLFTLEYKTNRKWICFVRAHSAVKGLSGIEVDGKKILNGNLFEDMNDLMVISDMLITDYSSSAGDFVLLKRPVILYQPDRDDYVKEDRSFYFDIDKSPYMIASHNEDLIRWVEKFKLDEIEKNCKDILKFYGAYETGNASDAVVDYIMSKKS